MPSPFRTLRAAAARLARRGPRPTGRRPDGERARAEARAARVWEELLEELPDEDLGEHPRDALETHRAGGRPDREEAEYLEVLRDAVDRMTGGR
ncbi:hypothetical protein [Streptomyces sp. URMC 125]|uniref:hypothetical protein n=1 Tax=Streptomyces sp. URMC 125 TaxID=3423419 RepID=UPI003F1B99EE